MGSKLPAGAAGLKLFRIVGKDRLVGCESVRFVEGRPAVEMTLRRAELAGRVEIGGKIANHFADVLNDDGDTIGDTVALDRGSYSALKNHWMRCRTEDLDDVLGYRRRAALSQTKGVDHGK